MFLKVFFTTVRRVVKSLNDDKNIKGLSNQITAKSLPLILRIYSVEYRGGNKFEI